jgi:hypothetical protein
MILQSNHRGVDFTVSPLSDTIWKWTFFTGEKPNAWRSGEAHGARETAIAECHKAIDSFLDGARPVDAVQFSPS